MAQAKLFSVNYKDILKGLLTACLGALVFGLEQSLSTGTLPRSWVDFQPILMGAVSGGVGYLIKNFFTNSKDEFGKSEPKNAGNP